MNVRDLIKLACPLFVFVACAGTVEAPATDSESPAGDATEEAVDETEDALVKVCARSACKGRPPLGPAVMCWDDSRQGPTGRCVKRTATSACRWEVRQCPPRPAKPDCSRPNACGKQPQPHNQLCHACVDDGGACRWKLQVCSEPSAP